MENCNWIAILVAAASAFFLGGLWYSPVLFLKYWLADAGVTEEQCKKGHGPLGFAISFLMSLIAATAFCMVFGPFSSLEQSIRYSLVVGVFWVATSFKINYGFGGRGMRIFLIDSGYHIFQFLLYGFIFGLWH